MKKRGLIAALIIVFCVAAIDCFFQMNPGNLGMRVAGGFKQRFGFPTFNKQLLGFVERIEYGREAGAYTNRLTDEDMQSFCRGMMAASEEMGTRKPIVQPMCFKMYLPGGRAVHGVIDTRFLEEGYVELDGSRFFAPGSRFFLKSSTLEPGSIIEGKKELPSRLSAVGAAEASYLSLSAVSPVSLEPGDGDALLEMLKGCPLYQNAGALLADLDESGTGYDLQTNENLRLSVFLQVWTEENGPDKTREIELRPESGGFIRLINGSKTHYAFCPEAVAYMMELCGYREFSPALLAEIEQVYYRRYSDTAQAYGFEKQLSSERVENFKEALKGQQWQGKDDVWGNGGYRYRICVVLRDGGTYEGHVDKHVAALEQSLFAASDALIHCLDES